MSTWVFDKMGGYYTIMMPSAITAMPDGSPPVASYGTMQDPATGHWYSCTDKFTIVSCPKCEVLPLRCKSDFGFTYR